jgi:ABC-2 type transport system permease protein
MFAGAASAAGLVTERKTGLLVRFRTLPGSAVAPLAGRILAEALRGMTGVVLVLAVGFLLGYRVADPVGIVGILGIALLMCIAFSSLLTWVGMVAATPEATVAVLPVMMVLMFCNTGFMPVEGFPSWLHGVVRLNPLSRTVEAMDACAGNGGAVVPALLWLVAVTVVGLVMIGLVSRRRD